VTVVVGIGLVLYIAYTTVLILNHIDKRSNYLEKLITTPKPKDDK
jgi:hypothetical protein